METKTKKMNDWFFFFFSNDKTSYSIYLPFLFFFFRLFHWSKNENEYLNHHFFHFTPLLLVHFIMFSFSYLTCAVVYLSLSLLLALFYFSFCSFFFAIMNRQNKLYICRCFCLWNMPSILAIIRHAISTFTVIYLLASQRKKEHFCFEERNACLLHITLVIFEWQIW